MQHPPVDEKQKDARPKSVVKQMEAVKSIE